MNVVITHIGDGNSLHTALREVPNGISLSEGDIISIENETKNKIIEYCLTDSFECSLKTAKYLNSRFGTGINNDQIKKIRNIYKSIPVKYSQYESDTEPDSNVNSKEEQ